MCVQPGNRIRFVRACVRASEAACAREAMLFPWLSDFGKNVLLRLRLRLRLLRRRAPPLGRRYPSRERVIRSCSVTLNHVSWSQSELVRVSWCEFDVNSC